MINLSSLGPHKVTIPLKLTAVEKFIEKDDTETLRLLKSKDQALDSKPIILEDPGIETNKDNNKLYYISDNNAELITRNPISVKKLIYIN